MDSTREVRHEPAPARRSGTLAWLPVILDCEALDPTETLLLVALADHVDADDTCFVGIERLAARARCSYSTARRKLTALTDRGFLQRQRRRREDGNLSVYEYVLVRSAFVPGEAEPSLRLGADHRSPGRALTIAHPDERAEPPSVEPPRGEQQTLVAVDAFERFWTVYPRKTAKGGARKAWPAALRAAGGDPAPILAGAGRYRDDPNRAAEFTAHAATWLRGERWTDDPLPPRSTRNGTNPAKVQPVDEDRSGPSGRVYV